jgi:F-type H+-transporting ATPase subunit b
MEQLWNDFSPGLFFMQAIILLILIFLLAKFAWKPILNSLDERESEIKDAIESAKQAREEMAQLSANNERLIQEAKEEQARILKEAQATANAVIAEAKDKAVLEMAAVKEKATASIAAEKSAAMAEIKVLTANLSVSIAEKILRNELKDKAAQDSLIDKYISEADILKA